MSQRIEYRVVWKREGRQRSIRICQSWSSAYRKAQGILALEAVKAETTFSGMPDLEQRPVIETRPVGDWTEYEFQVSEPTEGTKQNMLAIYRQLVDEPDRSEIPF